MPDFRNLSFDHLVVYIAVVETGSLTRAAERLGIGKTAVSKSIQKLESELGASLIARTTRRISVTEAGQAFFQKCQQITRLAEEAITSTTPASNDLRGTLRVAASIEYSAMVLAPALADLRRAHPHLRIELISGDRFIDMIEEGIDVAIRLGSLADSSHRAVPIGKYEKWLMASPGFVESRVLPRDLCEATNQPYVGLSVLPQPLRCQLQNATGEQRDLLFAGGFLANTVYGCRAIAAEGAGIALLPDFSVRADIESKRLVRVFPDWASAATPIQAIIPPGKHTAPKVRALIDVLKARVVVA